LEDAHADRRYEECGAEEQGRALTALGTGRGVHEGYAVPGRAHSVISKNLQVDGLRLR
jgi:hypothetical protein